MPDAPHTARAMARAELTRQILETAADQLAEVGPAALSLRQVARDLDLASSAVYRYFESRDALLTALIIDSFDDMGEAVETADAGCRRANVKGRLRAVLRALRGWAIAHPHRYALTYGSPVPGYVAPPDTVGAATRAAFTMLSILRDAEQAGHRLPEPQARISSVERAAIEPVTTFLDPPLSTEYAVRGVAAWSTLFGHVSLELFGHLHNAVLDYEAHFEAVLDQLVLDLGLDRVPADQAR